MRVGGIGGLIIMVILALIAIGVFASIASHQSSVNPSGPCIDGPVMGAPGQPVGNGNYRFACAGGGSTIVHLGNPGN